MVNFVKNVETYIKQTAAIYIPIEMVLKSGLMLKNIFIVNIVGVKVIIKTVVIAMTTYMEMLYEIINIIISNNNIIFYYILLSGIIFLILLYLSILFTMCLLITKKKNLKIKIILFF